MNAYSPPLFRCSRCTNEFTEGAYHVLMDDDGEVTEVLCEDCLNRLLALQVKT